jgi:DNA-binding NarL/FixJ family response regulator
MKGARVGHCHWADQSEQTPVSAELFSMPRIRKIRRRKVNQAAPRAASEIDAILPSRFRDEQSVGSASRVVIAGDRIFNVKLSKLLENESDLRIVGTAETPREALAAPNELGAELIVVSVDLGGSSQGVNLARTINERSPGCGIMLVCDSLSQTLARYLWTYGTDSWSVISAATSKNPAHIAEAVSSAVRGITWLEPGVARALATFGPRPHSLDERKLLLLDGPPESASA